MVNLRRQITLDYSYQNWCQKVILKTHQMFFVKTRVIHLK